MAESRSRASMQLAVLGSPISHSKSPALHAAAYRALGLDWEYRAVEMTGDRLESFLGSRDDEWRGLSLTYPLKHDVMPLLDEIDRFTDLSGAANTVRFEGGRRRGFNTDVGGIVRTLREADVTRLASCVLIGAGATAASALIAMSELGARRVEVLARQPERATALRELGSELGVAVSASPLGSLTAARAADLVVCTVPGGVELGVEASAELIETAPLLDVAYDPWPTAIATEWLSGGGTVVHGLGMLLHQALLQVRIFVTGEPDTPVDDEEHVLGVMRESLA